MAIKHILAPIDFSADSLNALTYARDLAKQFRAELSILHVVDQTYLAGTPELSVANPQLARILDEQYRACDAQLERLSADIKKTGQRCRTLVKRGVPSLVIAATAKKMGADLIVMGTHGRTGLAHMLIGSVAERVVRSAHCPVLTVRRAARKRKPAQRVRGKRA
jgi:universal stress protein A